MSGSPLLAAFGRALAEHDTLGIEWREGPRRRVFFLVRGELVLAQSNLRNETLECVTERNPGLDPTRLSRLATELRVTEALAEPGGTVTLHPGAPSPASEPGDLCACLWAASAHLPPLNPSTFPVARAASSLLARLPIDPELAHCLRELDGTRSAEDVVAFGPGEPDVTARALGLAAALGAIALRAEPATVATVTAGTSARATPTHPPPPARTPPSPAPPPSATRLASRRDPNEIAGFIQEGLGAAAPTAAAPRVDPAVARFGPDVPRIRSAADHFGVLGTTWPDSVDVHRRAYIALAQRLHPDRLTGEPPEIRALAEVLFERVRDAWEVLGDDAKREVYIARTIRGEKSEEEKTMDRMRSILEAESDFKRGVAELNAGRVPVAHDLFTRASAAVPDEVEFGAYAAYTTFRLAHGRDEPAAAEAARRLQAAVLEKDQLDGPWVLLGMLQRARGDDAGARRAFIAALKLKPSNPDAIRELRRLEREKEAAAPAGSFFSRLFGKK